MNRDLRNIAIVAGVCLSVLFLARPKRLGLLSVGKKNPAPSEAAKGDHKYENAVVAIRAVRDAINDNADKSTLELLRDQITKENQVKIVVKKGVISAWSLDGKTAIATEKA